MIKSPHISFRIILSIAACLLSTTCSASTKDTLETKNANYFRFKALGFVFIEDEWASSVSLGIEHNFSPSFSLVADIVHHRWKHEREVHDLPDPEQYSEYAQRDIRNFLAFEFRYYPFTKREKKDNHIYFNLYSKVGIRRLFTEDKFPFELYDQIQLKGRFADFGASMGMSKGTKFLADVSINGCYRMELFNEEVYGPGGVSAFYHDVSKSGWLPNIRFSFAVLLT